MDDTISRQAAIDALIAEGRNVDSRYLESERIIHVSDAVEAISMLPSAQRNGKWIYPYESTKIIIKCSECGFKSNHGLNPFNFCPNCGAGMKGKE